MRWSAKAKSSPRGRAIALVAVSPLWASACSPDSGSPSTLPGPNRDGTLCPSCVGGETSDFGGIIGDPCETQPRPLTDADRTSFDLAGLEAAVSAPSAAQFRWQLPNAQTPEVVLDTGIELQVTLNPDTKFLTRRPRTSETDASECPDQTVQTGTATLRLDDGSIAEGVIPVHVRFETESPTWHVYGLDDLAPIRGNLDLGLDPRQSYRGTISLQIDGEATQRCGSLRLDVADTQTNELAIVAQGSWPSGGCAEP